MHALGLLLSAIRRMRRMQQRERASVDERADVRYVVDAVAALVPIDEALRFHGSSQNAHAFDR